MAHDPESSNASYEPRDLSREEQIEELRAELKIGALVDPEERADARHQLNALENHDQPTGSEASPSSSLSEQQIKNITDQLATRRADIESKDPALAKEIWALDGAISYQRDAHRDHDLQTRIAYAVEDAEKITGTLNLPADVRAETTRLAATAPGLENKELKSLLAQTASIDDPALVKDLRAKAKELTWTQLSAAGPAQAAVNDAKTREEVYALAFRVATAPRLPRDATNPGPSADQLPDPQPASSPGARGQQNNPPSQQEAHRAADAPTPLQRAQQQIAAFDAPRPDTAPSRWTSSLTPQDDARAVSAADTPRVATQRLPQQANTVQTPNNPNAQDRSPADNPTRAQEQPANGTPANITYQKQGVSVRPLFGGPFQNLFNNIRDAARTQLPDTARFANQPRQPSLNNAEKPFSIAGRLDDHIEAKRQPTSQNTTLKDTYDAASVAIERIEAFRANEAASLLNKINDAAATTKGGIKEVLSELKPGGAFEDLRKEFNHLYSENESFRNAYDRASEALSDYGAKRAAVNNTILAQPHNPLAGEIKKLDAEIAHATQDIPGPSEGKSMTEKIAEEARKVVEAVLERLRNTFDRAHNATPSASPSPAP